MPPDVPNTVPDPSPALAITAPVNAPSPKPKKSKKWLVMSLVAVLVICLAGLGFWLLKHRHQTKASTTTPTPPATTAPTTTATPGPTVGDLQLVSTKNYGNKYKNGILPVGDNKFVNDAAKKGYIYVCNGKGFVSPGQAGAQTRGPWFVGTTQWDINKKVTVQGAVSWTPQLTQELDSTTRTLTTNDLPNHKTGVFPIASSDPAYLYDKNPNSIKTQTLIYALSAKPTYGSPQCISGEVGVMLTGVALFDGFDAGGRDAGAWEVQDGCDGHPQDKGEYHYHTLSRCIKDIGVGSVIGFALDGFPITGPKVGDNNFLTTDDLDECHGITSEITLDSKKVTMYHYVMTQDFPYSVSCFRSKAIQAPGLAEGSASQQPPSQSQSATQPPPPPH